MRSGGCRGLGKRVTCTLQDISRRFSILSCKSVPGEGRLSGTRCLTPGASNFNASCGTRLPRASAEVPGNRQEHTAILGKPQLPRSIPGASFSHVYPNPSTAFWSQWELMVEWFKVSLQHPQSQPFVFLFVPVLWVTVQ